MRRMPDETTKALKLLDKDVTPIQKGRGTMQVTFSDQEVEALRSALQSKLDELLSGIANTDSREYEEGLRADLALLEDIFGKLGCVHTEGAQTTVCETE